MTCLASRPADEDRDDPLLVMSPADADALAAELLHGLTTRLGGRHIDHARRVAAGVAGTADDQVIAAALLHDVLEKTAVTASELREITGDETLIALVEILTHLPGEPDHVYLARCASDPRTLLIKRVDLVDKLVAAPLDVPTDVVEHIRREATARLELLELLAADR